MGAIDYFIDLLCQEMDQEKSGGYSAADYRELNFENKLKLLIANETVLLER